MSLNKKSRSRPAAIRLSGDMWRVYVACLAYSCLVIGTYAKVPMLTHIMDEYGVRGLR